MRDSKRIRIVDTTLRDTFQGIRGTELSLEELVVIAEEIEQVGFCAAEVWGGTVFDNCLRFLFEDPWLRLRKLREIFKNTPVRVLTRGQNLFGYKHYPDDMVQSFIEMLGHYNVSIIRTYDPLNDLRNIQSTVETAKKIKMQVEVALVYCKSPLNVSELFLDRARQAADLGADSICIKDLTGTLAPRLAYTLVYRIRREIGLPVSVQANGPGGMASMAYIFGLMAGARQLDSAISPMALYSNQPALETIIDFIEGTRYDIGIDRSRIENLARLSAKVAEKHFTDAHNRMILNYSTVMYGFPFGLLSNIVSHLTRQGHIEKLGQVLREVRVIEKELGYPPLVAPLSQLVGLQAVSNVLSGERYKFVPKEIKWYLRGWYGSPPADISREVLDKVLVNGEDKQRIDVRPADLLEPRLDRVRGELDPALIRKEEDLLSYALFPEIALRFFKFRQDPEKFRKPELFTSYDQVDPLTPSVLRIEKLSDWMDERNICEMTIEDGEERVYLSKQVSEESRMLSPITDILQPSAGTESRTRPRSAEAVEQEPAGRVTVKSPMVGVFYEAPSPGASPFVNPGDRVSENTTVCIVEAMKLFNEIKAECSGTVEKVLVKNGESVIQGQPLIQIKQD